MSYKLPLASTTDFGSVSIGSGINITDGVISSSAAALNYGFFTDGTQTNPVANAVNLVTLNVTGPSNGVSIVGGTEITVAVAGVYTKMFTMNITKTSGGSTSVSIWLRYNGVDVVGSCQDLVLTNTLDIIFVSGNYTIPMAAGSNIQICWSSADTTMTLVALPSRVNPNRPTGDSAKVTVTKIN